MPDNDLVPGTGQVPPGAQSPDSNGQVPPASQGSSTNSGRGDDSSVSSGDDLTPAQYRDLVEKLRKENARYRKDDKRLAELETAEQQRQDAALSEKERYEKKLADYQEKLNAALLEKQETLLRFEVRLAAQQLGLNPELARRILDTAAIEYGEDGDPANVVELLTKAALDYGLAVQTPGASGAATPTQQQQNPAQQQPSAVPLVGATNPTRGGRGQSAPPAKDPSQLARFGQGRELFKRQ